VSGAQRREVRGASPDSGYQAAQNRKEKGREKEKIFNIFEEDSTK
jgi:hypothetical protein